MTKIKFMIAQGGDKAHANNVWCQAEDFQTMERMVWERTRNLPANVQVRVFKFNGFMPTNDEMRQVWRLAYDNTRYQGYKPTAYSFDKMPNGYLTIYKALAITGPNWMCLPKAQPQPAMETQPAAEAQVEVKPKRKRTRKASK